MQVLQKAIKFLVSEQSEEDIDFTKCVFFFVYLSHA